MAVKEVIHFSIGVQLAPLPLVPSRSPPKPSSNGRLVSIFSEKTMLLNAKPRDSTARIAPVCAHSIFSLTTRTKLALDCQVCGHSIRCTSLVHDVIRQTMGEYKVQLGLRVRQALRVELEEFAAREKRKLGNVGEVILEWGFEQLKQAGSIDRLLKYKIRPPMRQPK
jgi:hypothetical protein